MRIENLDLSIYLSRFPTPLYIKTITIINNTYVRFVNVSYNGLVLILSPSVSYDIYIHAFFFKIDLRGCTADIILLEEAAYIDQNIFNKIVAPLIGMDNTAVLAISTPDDEFNYYSELAESEIFKVLYMGKECALCDSVGVLCIHKKLKVPDWKTDERIKKLDKFIKDKALLERENQGRITSNKQFMFKQWVEPFVGRPSFVFRNPVQVIHVAIDPAAGAESSDYAIGSLAYESGTRVVNLYFITNNIHESYVE